MEGDAPYKYQDYSLPAVYRVSTL